MKKLIALVLSLVCVLGLVGCGGSGEKHTIEIIIPAGSTEAFVYADEVISPQNNTLKIWVGAGIDATQVILKPVDVAEENAYTPVIVKRGKPIKINVEKGAWFKIGIGIMNPSDKDITTSIIVEGVEISSQDYFDSDSDLAAQFPHFMAKILEIHDNYLLVEPEVGMEELKSADKFEIPLDDVDNPTELQVDDSVLIVYDGEILETYPAKLGEVYSVGKTIIIPVDNSKESN